MSDENYGGQAFPGGGSMEFRRGMSLRYWFAGQALTGFLADGTQRKVAKAITESAEAALVQDDKAKTAIINELIAEGMYSIADAMLEARK